MDVKIYPGFAQGEVNCPYSKSIMHRALICASLASGLSVINNVTLSDDIIATIDCLRVFGADIKIAGNQIIVRGIKEGKNKNEVLEVNESASTLRFLIPISTLFFDKVIFKGKKSLFRRPLVVYEEVFRKQKLKFVEEDYQLTVSGKLKSGDYLLNGNCSSQFFSGLLFYLPLLPESSTITIRKPYYSQGYVALTIDILKKFGIEIIKKTKYELHIPGNQTYKPTTINNEIDYSHLAFWLGLATMNGNLVCNQVDGDSKQPDFKIIRILQNANVRISRIGRSLLCEKSTYLLDNLGIDNQPDLGPILACIASQSQGKVTLTGVKRLVSKESNRLNAVCNNLKNLNIEVTRFSLDKIMIHPGKVKALAPLDSYSDHRIFMAFAILATISENPVIIKNYECIQKSYPNFLKDLAQLQIKFEYIN